MRGGGRGFRGNRFSPRFGSPRRGYYGRPPAYGQGGYGYGVPPAIVEVPVYIESDLEYDSDSEYDSDDAHISTDSERDDDSIFAYDY